MLFAGRTRRLIFVARKSGRDFSRTIDLDGLTIRREPKFLSENLVLSGQRKYLFLFARSRSAWVDRIAEDLRARIVRPAPLEEPALVSV